MSSLPSSDPAASSATNLSPATRRTALIAVTTLFFMWGFLTCLNDIIIPHLRNVFHLNYFQAFLVQFSFFGAYFIMSLPAGAVIARVGYHRGMVIGLLTAGLGTLLFYPAASYLSYGFFLFALFVLSTGITLLQVAANPYISILGKPETSASRLNLAQAFNSLGTTLAPWFGSFLILSAVALPAVMTDSQRLTEAASVKIPYLCLTGVLVFLAILLAFIPLPTITTVEETDGPKESFFAALRIPHVAFGTLAIFLYVGAEVAIGSALVNFLEDPHIAGLDEKTAGSDLKYYWGAAMIGRFIGSALLQFIRTNVLLAVAACAAVVLLAVGFFTSGSIAMWSVLAIGLFNSVMFPNIFTLGIANLGHLTGRASSLLIMAIVGGAIVPEIMGITADQLGLQHSLFIPALCYLYIIFYGLSGYKSSPSEAT
jgi:FHS family L-fucose permease-like MFS transporter